MECCYQFGDEMDGLKGNHEPESRLRQLGSGMQLPLFVDFHASRE